MAAAKSEVFAEDEKDDDLYENPFKHNPAARRDQETLKNQERAGTNFKGF